MIERLIKDVEAKLKELWPGKDYGNSLRTATRQKDGTWILHISDMYEAPGLSFHQLMNLSEFFDTMNVETQEEHHGGCETCDYGSSYGFDIYVSTGDPFPFTKVEAAGADDDIYCGTSY